MTPRPELEHLKAECARLDWMVHRQTLRRRLSGLFLGEEFASLQISDAQLEETLRAAEPGASMTLAELSSQIEELRGRNWTAEHAGLPLPRLACAAGLTSVECDLVLMAAAPELDSRYQILFAGLQHDSNARRASVDLALRMTTHCFDQRIDTLRSFAGSSPLLRYRLIRFAASVHEPDLPLPARCLAADARLVGYLLGSSALDQRLQSAARHLPRDTAARKHPDFALGKKLSEWPGSVALLFKGPDGCGRQDRAASLAAQLGHDLLVVDLRLLTAEPDLLALIRREALLCGASIYLKSFEALLSPEAPLRTLLPYLHEELRIPGRPLLLGAESSWHPQDTWPDVTFLTLEATAPTVSSRRGMWKDALNGKAAGIDLAPLAGRFALTPRQVSHAVREANLRTAGVPETADLLAAARSQSNVSVSGLARKIQPIHSWPDLILPRRQVEQLEEVVRSVRYRERVLAQWGFERKMSGGKGVAAMFSGASGTGKTMAASILASELDLDLYKIDLASVVSKYIGETERNLAELFRQGQRSNGILFFDEADALFGKRSEVKDAHDRYANIEVAYLLQRIEEYEGVVILATNLTRNIDEAFARRLQYSIEFPAPDAPTRLRLWARAFPADAPVEPTVDFAFLARQFELTGGNIRNIALNAAFLAAANGKRIRMPHVILATGREYQKIGRLPTRSDFLEYYELLRQKA